MKFSNLILFVIVFTSMIISQSFWERLPGGNATNNVTALAEDLNNNIIFAGTPSGGGIFVSTNGGSTWSLKSNGLPVNQSVKSIAVGNNGAVYALLNKIYKSTNGGNNWELLVNSPDGMTNIFITSGGNIFVGQETTTAGNGIYLSSNAGAAWVQKCSGIPTVVIGPFTYYRSITGIVTDQSGNLFASVGGGNASTESGVYKSTNNGDSWVRASSGLLADAQVKPISITGGGLLYVGVKNRIYKSDNGSMTWTVTDSIPMSVSNFIRKIIVDLQGAVFASTSGGTFKGATGGIGWTSLNTLNTQDFLILSSGSYMSGSLDGFSINGGIHISTDGGTSWVPSNNGISNDFTSALYVAPTGYIYNGLPRGIIDYSNNSGMSFQRVVLPYGLATSAGVAVIVANQSGILFTGTGEGIYTSSDDGANWVKKSSTSIRCFYIDINGNVIAGGQGGAYRSTDNGQSWSSLAGGGNVYNIFVTNAGTILAGTFNAGINRTTDNGSSWNNSGTSLLGSVTIGKFTQTQDGTIYTHTLGGLFKSTDDGASWSAINVTGINQQFRTLISKGNTLLLGTPNGLYKSTDGFMNWTNHLDGLLWTVLDYLSISSNGHLFGAGGSGIYRSSQPVVTSVSLSDETLFSDFKLYQNYPNPFNPFTSIQYQVANNSLVSLKVYDVLGNEVATLVDEYKEAGRYKVEFKPSNLTSGIYFYQLRAGSFTKTKTMSLIK